MKRNWKQRRGFVLIMDVITAFAIVGILAAVLAGAVGRERRAGMDLADSRAAGYLAEHVLLDLQHHQTVVLPSAEQKIVIDRLGDGQAPAGYAWARVRTTVRGRAAELIGIVRADALPEKGGGS